MLLAAEMSFYVELEEWIMGCACGEQGKDTAAEFIVIFEIIGTQFTAGYPSTSFFRFNY